MGSHSKFYYPLIMYVENSVTPSVAPFLSNLPLQQVVEDFAVILETDVGKQIQGLHVYDGRQWRFAMPMTDISAGIVVGDTLAIYTDLLTPVTIPPGSVIYKNGIIQTSNVLDPGSSIYCVMTPPVGGGGGGGGTVTLSGDVSGIGVSSIFTTLANSGVTAGTFTKVTVDAKGRVTSATNLASADVSNALGFTPYNATNPAGYITSNQNITATGDVTGSGATTLPLTLTASGVTAGTYTKVTVDAKGRVTVGAQLSQAEILTALGYTPLNAAGGNVGPLTLVGGTVTGLPTPVNASDAASKVYVDTSIAAVVNGVHWKLEAQVATTANIALTGLQTIDGYSAVAGNRVLVKAQTNPIENGVYVVAAGAWSRSLDTDTGAEIMAMAILILNGTANGLTQWVNTNATTPVIGTTNITYAQLQGVGVVYAAGAGLTLTGATFSITDSGVVAGTFTKVTVNAKGQVTTGTQLASGDVTTALGFTPYNATNPAGYITGNQVITHTGDVTGSGTTSIPMTLAATGVTAGTYNTVTVDAKGRVTSASNTSGTNQPITLSGDATGTGATAITVVLTASGVTPGTYTKVTVDAKGRVTLGATQNTSDITTALGYTPYDAANPAGYITTNAAITATGDVTGSGTTSLPLTLIDSGVTAGTYNQVTVDAKGRVTVGANTTPTNANITVSGDASGSGTTAIALTLSNTGVVAGTYNSLTVDAKGRVTGATNTTPTNQPITISGAATGSGTTAIALTLANSGVTAGTYNSLTVNAKGLVTAATNTTPTNQPITLSGDATGTGATSIAVVLAASGVTAGTYNSLTVNAKGLVTAATNTTPTNANITVTGDVTGSGTTAIALTLANSGVTAGTFTKVTVDAKGRVTVGAQLASADVTTALGFTPISPTANNTWTGVQTFNGTAAQAAMRVTNALEITRIVAGAPASVQTLYPSLGAVQYYTANATANWTINFAWSAGTTLNAAMAVGDSQTVAMITTQGATAFMPTAFQVDGAAVTPKWQGTVPTAGNINALDVYTFTIIKTAASTYTVMASQSPYK